MLSNSHSSLLIKCLVKGDSFTLEKRLLQTASIENSFMVKISKLFFLFKLFRGGGKMHELDRVGIELQSTSST